jgi:type I restriction enzyme M protein
MANGKVSYQDIKQWREIKEINGDEEMVRAFLLTRLVNALGYPADRIEIEREYTAGRPHTNTSRIDVVVRDAAGDAFLFFELKSPLEYAKADKDIDIEEQLFKVAGMERTDGRSVKYLVLYTVSDIGGKAADECIIIDSEKFLTFADWVSAGRESVNSLPACYGKARRIPYVKASGKDLERDFTYETLDRLQTDLHNVLWGGGGTDDNEVFSSLTNLILAKIQDEDEKEDGQTYDFQSLAFAVDGDEEFETNDELFDRINALYRRALKAKLYITDEAELRKSYVVDTKKFSLAKLKYTIQKLEGLSFVDGKNSFSGKDILGDFFEGIIRGGFKQSKGQFFTHINVVRFMLWAMQADKLAIKRINEDKEIPYMVDPSAGSGTFLLEYMKFITQNIKYRFQDKIKTSRAVQNNIQQWFYPEWHEHIWAKDYIYASEINFNLGTAIKVNMILHGDGSTNIFVKDGLLPFPKYEKETTPNAMNKYAEDPFYQDRAVNGQFDLILTNPPFSVELDNDTKKTVTKDFMFGGKKNSENLFVERWYQLLRENGRLAAVLPESVYDTTENKYIRLFLYKYFKIKAVVSLPQLTFEPFTSTKTSILFAQKKTKQEIEAWNKAWTIASKEYAAHRTIVENLLAVYDGTKQKSKLPSIKDLSAEEEATRIRHMLKNHLTVRDDGLDATALIHKYRSEIEEMCKHDRDTQDLFGFVNTWWVFGEVAARFDYSVFMAEADSIGYKRSKRGEKPMPNDLYRTDKDGAVMVDDGLAGTVLDEIRKIHWD